MKRQNDIPPEFDKPVRVTDVLDLHGFFPEQVEEVVEAFLTAAQEAGYAEVRIIHGKGRSRLKWHVLRVLEQHPAAESWGDAPPERGGWGSTIVRVRTAE